MDKLFVQQILQRHRGTDVIPPNNEIAAWAAGLIGLLFPERADQLSLSELVLLRNFENLKTGLENIIAATLHCTIEESEQKSDHFFKAIPKIYEVLQTDVAALEAGDPAANNSFEVIRAYPGFYAVAYYRIAHALHQLQIPLIPRILTEHAHSVTGIDIHPGAQIGAYFFIDHGTGTVIGETSVLGEHVKLYQGVTLGALSVDKNFRELKRHPTVEDYAIIYSGATILGGETVIGHHSIVGGNVWLTKSIPPNSTVYHKAAIEMVAQE